MTVEAWSIPDIGRTPGYTVRPSRCSRELTCHDPTVHGQTGTTIITIHPNPLRQGPRPKSRVGAVAARATQALTATTWAAVATLGESKSIEPQMTSMTSGL